MIKRDWRTSANFVSTIRLGFSWVPAFLILGGPDHVRFDWWWIVLAFLAVSLTDALDGYLARSRNAVTELGARLDPLVDKVLVILTLVALCIRGSEVQGLLLMATGFIIVREVGVEILRHLGHVGAASKLGKIKMVSQIVMIVVLIIPLEGGQLWLLVQTVLITIATVLTIASGVAYFTSVKEREEQ